MSAEGSSGIHPGVLDELVGLWQGLSGSTKGLGALGGHSSLGAGSVIPVHCVGAAQEGVPSFGGFSGSPEKEEKGRNVAQDWREQCTTACALRKAELCEIKSHCHAGH